MDITSSRQPLIVRLPNWIGDACMALPALHLLKSQGYELILVGQPWAQALFRELPYVDFCPISGVKAADKLALKARVRGLKKPKGLLLTNSLSSALLFKSAGIKSVGYRTDWRRFFMKKTWIKPNNVHEVDVFFTLARYALAYWKHGDLPDSPPSLLNLPQSFETHQKALQVLEQANVSHPFIIIAPTAVGRHQGKVKAWQHYSELAREFKQLSHTCVICPAPGEEEALAKLVPDAVCLPSQPLDIVAALLHQSQLVICNDSGTSHLAAAVNAQQLTIFGVTDPKRTGPWSEQATMIGSSSGWPSLEEVFVQSLSMLQDTYTNGSTRQSSTK